MMKRQQDVALAGDVWTDQRADVSDREVQRLDRPRVLDSDSADSHGGSRAACRICSRMDGPGVGKCFCGLELALWSESYGSALAVMIRW